VVRTAVSVAVGSYEKVVAGGWTEKAEEESGKNMSHEAAELHGVFDVVFTYLRLDGTWSMNNVLPGSTVFVGAQGRTPSNGRGLVIQKWPTVRSPCRISARRSDLGEFAGWTDSTRLGDCGPRCNEGYGDTKDGNH
jgi:hypothetical protein